MELSLFDAEYLQIPKAKGIGNNWTNHSTGKKIADAHQYIRDKGKARWVKG